MNYFLIGAFFLLGSSFLLFLVVVAYKCGFNKGVDSIVSRLSRDCLRNLYDQLEEEFKGDKKPER